MIPNPWILLAFAIMIAGAGWKGYDLGYDSANGKWIKANAEIERQTNTIIVENKDKIIAAERKYNELKDKVEKDNVETVARINGLRIANGRLVAAHGGLYDRNGRPSGANPMPGNPGSTGQPASGSTGCKLSRELEEFLLSESYRADLAATYAKSCHAWIEAIK